jgi:hypothetical protein
MLDAQCVTWYIQKHEGFLHHILGKIAAGHFVHNPVEKNSLLTPIVQRFPAQHVEKCLLKQMLKFGVLKTTFVLGHARELIIALIKPMELAGLN